MSQLQQPSTSYSSFMAPPPPLPLPLPVSVSVPADSVNDVREGGCSSGQWLTQEATTRSNHWWRHAATADAIPTSRHSRRPHKSERGTECAAGVVGAVEWEKQKYKEKEGDEAAADEQWEQHWGVGWQRECEWQGEEEEEEDEDEERSVQWRHGDIQQRVDEPLPLSITQSPPLSSNRRSLQWSAREEATLPFDAASLSLATHPIAFRSLLSAAHTHLFLLQSSSVSSVSALSSPLPASSPSVVRSCVLVLQCIPSSLFRLSPDTAEFVVDSTSTDCLLLPSARQLLVDFADIASRLLSIERLVECLSAQSSDVVSVAFGGALRSFCSHHKQQVESIVRQREASGTTSRSSCTTVIQLHVAAQPLVQQILWVHRLLLLSAPPAPPLHPSAASPPSLPSIPAGVALLDYLYSSAQSLSLSSPFHATLTFLFSSALLPYLRVLSTCVSHPLTASSRSTLQLPSFLQCEREQVNSACEMLRVTDRAGGSQWTTIGQEGNSGKLLSLSIGWSVREAERLLGERLERGRAQQAQLTAAVERVEATLREAIQQRRARTRLINSAQRRQLSRTQAEEGDAEDESESARRTAQFEYREQLRQQLEEKRRRHNEEAERERVEGERVAVQEQRRRTIIDEEKERLMRQLQAVEQGKSIAEVRREEWNNRRNLRAESIRTLWREDRRQQESELKQQQHTRGRRQTELGQYGSESDEVLEEAEEAAGNDDSAELDSRRHLTLSDESTDDDNNATARSHSHHTSARTQPVSPSISPAHLRSSSDPSFAPASAISSSAISSHARSLSVTLASSPSSADSLSSPLDLLPAFIPPSTALNGGSAAAHDEQTDIPPLLARSDEAAEAYSDSSAVRMQARQRNLTSRVFDQKSQQQPSVGGDEQVGSDVRRHESDALVSNRYRMTSSRVFESESESESEDVQQSAEPEPHQPSVTIGTLSLSPLPAEEPIDESPVLLSSIAALTATTDSTTTTTDAAALSTDSQPNLPLTPITPTVQSTETSATPSPTQPLPIAIAVRSTFLPSLRQQCSFIQQASLAFFLHSVRVRDHFLILQHFFLFRAGSTMDAFTTALFHSISRHSNNSADSDGVVNNVTLSSQSLQLLWSDAVRSCPPSTDPSRILPMLDSTGPSLSSSAFSRIESLRVVDSVRLHYTAPPAVSHLLPPTALAGYGRVFTLLMRLAHANSEIRRMYAWLRTQETLLRRKEVKQAARVKQTTATARSTADSTRRRVGAVAAASDDSQLLSPTRRIRPQPHILPASPHRNHAAGTLTSPSANLLFSPSRLSSSSSRDDDRYLVERRAVVAARRFLHHTAVQVRWRLRWLHAARAEMQHLLVCLNQYVHLTVVHAHTTSFNHTMHTVSTVAQLTLLHASYIADMTAALHVNSQSPLAALVEALIATTIALSAAVTALSVSTGSEGGTDSELTEYEEEEEEGEERVEIWQAVRDLHRQFRGHALLMSRVLHIAVSEHSGGVVGVAGDMVSGVVQLQCALDFNGYYAQRRQRELEERVLN